MRGIYLLEHSAAASEQVNSFNTTLLGNRGKINYTNLSSGLPCWEALVYNPGVWLYLPTKPCLQVHVQYMSKTFLSIAYQYRSRGAIGTAVLLCEISQVLLMIWKSAPLLPLVAPAGLHLICLRLQMEAIR